MSHQQPELYRQETDFSKSDLETIDHEKGISAHRENINVPHAIPEGDEDEDGNVGQAAYERSKHMAEIVSVPFTSSRDEHTFTCHAFTNLRLQLKTRPFSRRLIGSFCLSS
jgi:hypothetical protein